MLGVFLTCRMYTLVWLSLGLGFERVLFQSQSQELIRNLVSFPMFHIFCRSSAFKDPLIQFIRICQIILFKETILQTNISSVPIAANSSKNPTYKISLPSLLPHKQQQQMQTNSYFSKHKQALAKQSRLKSSIININTPIKKQTDTLNDHKLQQLVHEKHKSQHASFIDVSLEELKTQEQKVYQQYKEIKNKYQQELKELSVEVQRLRREGENQMKKIKQAEANLEGKKKQLRATKMRYEQMKAEYEKQQVQNISTQKIQILQAQLSQLTQKNSQKLLQLQQSYKKSSQQNSALQQKLQQLQLQYKKVQQFDRQKFEVEKQKLEQQQKSLKEELQSLQNQSDRLRIEIQKIQDMKPVTNQIHKKYLDLFEKVFIGQELEKAEKIMRMKEQERKFSIELVRRKDMVKEKQKEIQQREARVGEKNKLVDKLTAEIRQKSTLLLTKYQQEVDKHKK